MSKVTAPLLSFGARGQIGKTQVYGDWRGIQYARRYVVPANPQSVSQTQTRDVFTYLNAVFKLIDPEARAAWDAFVIGKPLISRNKWIGSNLPQLRTASDNTGMVLSPGAKGGVAFSGFTPTGGVGSIACAFTVPALPSGWTVSKSVAIALKNQDPHSATDFSSTTGTATSTPWTVNLTVAADSYVVGGILVYTTDTGDTAYSPSVVGTATAT